MEGEVVSAIADVARAAGVSKATASRALSGRGYVSADTRERVVRAAADMGFVVSSNAASLVTGQSRNVGVVIPHLDRWFFTQVLEGIESALIAAGYDLTLYRLSADADQRRRVFDYFLVRKRVDAVIAVGIALTPNEVAMLVSLGKPIVGVGGEIGGIATLSIDDVAAARLATEHVIALGHRRLMHLGGENDEQADFRVLAHRLEGFRQALAAEGLDTDSIGADFRTTVFSIPGGFEAGLAVLADAASRPTAIVAGCDEIAIGVIIAARQLGVRVPEELSVVGIDDHELAGMFGLTTVRQEPAAQGALAVTLALDELAGQSGSDAPAPVLVPVELRLRASTAPPAGENDGIRGNRGKLLRGTQK